MGAPMSDKGFAIRVMIGATIFVVSLVLSIVAAASAADAFSFGFRGPSVRTETAQKDPMFHTEHMHDFFCANAVTDPTSYAALVGRSTSCKRTTDHSAYWMPQLKINGTVQKPTRAGFYYQCLRPFSARQCANVRPFPKGFRMVTGERPGDFGDVKWHCDVTRQKNAQERPPASCSDTARGIGMIIRFPECWNGKNVDPATATKPHVVNARHKSGGGYGCPDTHPIHLPTLRIFPDYPNAPTHLNTVKVSVGHNEWGPQSSYHANTISAFTGDSMATLTKYCITKYPLQKSPTDNCDLG
jgi:Domain of unknown function (DUF1996)